MTVVSLYDIFERQDQPPSDHVRKVPRLTKLAERLVQSVREDYRRLRELEREFGEVPEDDDLAELEVLRSIWRLFDDWSRDAEQVLARVARLNSAGHAVPNSEDLRDDYGQVRARLSITPEQIILSKQQARRGEVVSATELRNELRARVRP